MNTHHLLQRVLTGAPDLAGKEKPPSHFISYQMQVQISGSEALVKPAGLKSYVSLPSTCIQVLAFLVCAHDLLQWACLSLQDIELQQEPGADGLYGHTGSSHQGSLSQQTDYNRCVFLH